MKAMILAAGYGKRMRPLTDSIPKPLIPVKGKPLIEYHLENLRRAGIQEVIINTAYLGEKIRAHLGNGEQFNLQIHYSNETEPLETGGGILHAGRLLGDAPFLLVNGDIWLDMELNQWIGKSLQQHQLGHLLLVENPAFHPQGDFALNHNGVIVPDAIPHSLGKFTFAGISLLRPEVITEYPNKREIFPLAEAIRFFIPSGRFTGEIYRGHWSDVGTIERLNQLHNLLSN
jgi:N-acetyl-alpha-D-muramate 1-phosphate uridylyltransferase